MTAKGTRISDKYLIDKRTLEYTYFELEYSTVEIARFLGVNPGRITERMKELNIPARSKSQAIRLKVNSGLWHDHGYSGKNCYNWKGGTKIVCSSRNGGGYILEKCPNHTRATKNGYVLQHILIWEKVHNQALPDGYIIHHINGIKQDNRPENLVALPNKAHYNLLSVKSQKIRELEARVNLLEQALRSSQLMFNLSEN